MKSTRFYIAVGLISLLFGTQALYSALKNGQTTDETYYSAAGYAMVRYNNYRFLGEHPPLIMQLGSIPLLLLKPNFQIENPVYLPGTNAIDISRNGAKFLYEMGNDPRQVLFLQRLPVVLLAVLLGACIAFLGRGLFGEWGGIASFLLYAFDPNMLAHGSLFTTDMGITAFFFFSIYALKVFFDRPSLGAAVIAGVFLGLAFLSKISGLALFPVATILFLFYFVYAKKISFAPLSERSNKTLGFLAIFLLIESIGQKQAMVTIGPLCLLAFYLCFRENQLLRRFRFTEAIFYGLIAAGTFLALFFSWKLKKKYGVGVAGVLLALNFAVIFFSISLQRFWNKEAIVVYVKYFLAVWLVAGLVIILGYTDFFTKIFSFTGFGHFVQPLGQVLSHSQGTHRACVDGSFIRCDWRYFFGLLAIKTPLLTLGLAALGSVLILRLEKSVMSRALILVPPTLFFLAAIFNGINIGLRHILPIYPFLFLLSGFAVAQIFKKTRGFVQKGCVGILLVLFGFNIIRSINGAPDYIAYFNEAIGGSGEGAKLVADSNINWGQDNVRLAQFVRAYNVPLIKIVSETMNPDIYQYEGIAWKNMDTDDFIRPLPGYYALGIRWYTAEQQKNDSWFKGRKPDYRVGNTFYVFKVT